MCVCVHVCKGIRSHRCKLRRKGEGQTDLRCVWLCGCCATNEESALLGWVLKVPGGLIAVENAAGEPIAEVESRVVSMTRRWPTFPRDISTSMLILGSKYFQILIQTHKRLTTIFKEGCTSFLQRNTGVYFTLLTRRHFCAK